ncbi:MAG: hypothetical protein HY422_03305 [Candidatus Komeilibacteria bacterium]|nr:hypothetical protein [Candidatus Komeilibacteria bacterium]
MSFLHNPFRSFSKIRLTARERAEIRHTLVSFMQQYPLPERARFSRLHMLLKPAALTFASLVVVATAGAGISYAAERSLPGSPLYAVKINLNEKILSALARTPQTQAQWDVHRIERRLEEAEQLIAEGRLDIQTSSTLAYAVTEHADSVRLQLGRALEEKHILEAANLQANLRATINAHANLIDRITVREGAGEVKKPLSLALSSQANRVTYENDSPDAETTFVIVPTDPSDTEKKKREAGIKLQEAASQLDKASSTLDADTVRKVHDLLSRANESQTQAANVLSNGDNGNAFGFFQRTHRLAQEAKYLIDARDKLRNANFTTGGTTTTSTTSQNAAEDKQNDKEIQKKSGAAGTGTKGSSKKNR